MKYLLETVLIQMGYRGMRFTEVLPDLMLYFLIPWAALLMVGWYLTRRRKVSSTILLLGSLVIAAMCMALIPLGNITFLTCHPVTTSVTVEGVSQAIPLSVCDERLIGRAEAIRGIRVR